MKFKVKENYVLTFNNEGAILMNTGTFQSSHLNKDGIRLLEFIEKSDSWESLIKMISEKISSPSSVFEVSIKKFLKTLFQLGVVEFESIPDWIKEETTP